MTTHTESEAARIARVPGIEFVDGSGGRLARVTGSGVAVFEIARTYTMSGGNMALVQMVYDSLTPEQIRAALIYWRTYPPEIEARIARDENCVDGL